MNTKQILVLAIVILFILSSLFIGGSFVLNNPDIGGENISGQILFNGTIRTYDPVIFVETNDSLSSLEASEGVLSIVPQGGYIMINTETRDDVLPLANEIRALGYQPIARANIVAPNNLKMEFGTNILNISHLGGAIVAITEPVIDSGEVVEVSMLGIARNNVLIDYQNAYIVFRQRTLVLEGQITANSSIYSYMIPWEERNDVDFENLSKSNLIQFSELTPQEIIEKRGLPYIEFIDTTTAVVNENFSNRTIVESDFQNVTYPPSILESRQDLNLTYNRTVQYIYNITFVSDEYALPENSFSIQSQEELNESVELPVRILISGDNVVSILPS